MLDKVTKQAKVLPRLRKSMDLWDPETDGSKMILNAVKPGTTMSIHRFPFLLRKLCAIVGISKGIFIKIPELFWIRLIWSLGLC